MKTPDRLLVPLVSLVAACWFAGCTSPATTGTAAATKPDEVKITKGLIPALEIGMTAEAIRAKLGNPAEIQQMDTAEQPAEIWIYHFEGPVQVVQVPTTMATLPATDTADYRGQIRTVQEPQYSLAEQRTRLTLKLLVFQGRLAAQKTTTDSKQSYK